MIQPDPNFERLKKTLYCGQADRVPLAEVTIDEGAKESFLGKSINDFATDLEFYIKAGYDYITLGRRIAGFPPIWESARLENYYEIQRQIGHGRTKGFINNWSDFKDYPWNKQNDLDFRIFDEAEKILPREMKVICSIGPVFQITWMLMGFESFSINLIEETELVDAVFDKIFEIVYWQVENLLKRDIIGAVWYGDDIAIKDRLMVSPNFLKKIFFPKLKIIADRCKERNIPLIYHTDGNISEVIQDIIYVGVNALHPIDPTAMDIYKLKNEIAGKLCLIGNIDVHMLLEGSPKEIEEDTKKHLKSLGPGGGYVVGSGNSIHRNIKRENYRAMLETVLKYGNYPIKL